MPYFEKACSLLREFKGDSYLFDAGVLSKLGKLVAPVGKGCVLIRGGFAGSDDFVSVIRDTLSKSGVEIAAQIKGARPNCPQEDVFRIADELKRLNPGVIISFGGGSTIDAVKAAEVLRTSGGEIDSYFGTGLVTQALKDRNTTLTPHVAVQTVSSSAAHLTKYSNITNLSTGQKKLIVDEAIVPAYPVFDYETTYSQPKDLTADGAMDGIAHCLEVLYGAVGKPFYNKITEIAGVSIALVVKYLPYVMQNLQDKKGRRALGLATDLGGYAIMTGGTNGGHLTSFSLVDILSHGRACAIMNPYYTVLFAPAIEETLRFVGQIYRKEGLTDVDMTTLKGRELGVAVAEAMFEFAHRIGFPTKLNQVIGFTSDHINRALTAAKNPQLKMKLQNMPVPLTSEMVDEYMGSVLEAACDGNLKVIKNV